MTEEKLKLLLVDLIKSANGSAQKLCHFFEDVVRLSASPENVVENKPLSYAGHKEDSTDDTPSIDLSLSFLIEELRGLTDEDIKRIHLYLIKGQKEENNDNQ
ncbi:MAG: hypothetical protein ACRCU3_05980 [Eubacteriaceae bacterium]